jgi:hypothetical protein
MTNLIIKVSVLKINSTTMGGELQDNAEGNIYRIFGNH